MAVAEGGGHGTEFGAGGKHLVSLVRGEWRESWVDSFVWWEGWEVGSNEGGSPVHLPTISQRRRRPTIHKKQHLLEKRKKESDSVQSA